MPGTDTGSTLAPSACRAGNRVQAWTCISWCTYRIMLPPFTMRIAHHRLPGGVLQESSQSLKVARLHGIMDGAESWEVICT